MEDFIKQLTLTKCGPIMCPLSEDFVLLWALTKCGPIMCPLSQMWSNNVPLVGGLCLSTNFDQMWYKNVLLVGGLCLAPDFNQMRSDNVPLVGRLCLTADFDQMWSDNVHLVRRLCLTADFDQMWSKHVPLNGGPFCYGVWPNMDQTAHSLLKGWYKTNGPTVSFNAELNYHCRLHYHMISTLENICCNKPWQKMAHLVSIMWQMTNDTDHTQPSLPKGTALYLDKRGKHFYRIYLDYLKIFACVRWSFG